MFTSLEPEMWPIKPIPSIHLLIEYSYTGDKLFTDQVEYNFGVIMSVLEFQMNLSLDSFKYEQVPDFGDVAIEAVLLNQ